MERDLVVCFFSLSGALRTWKEVSSSLSSISSHFMGLKNAFTFDYMTNT